MECRYRFLLSSLSHFSFFFPSLSSRVLNTLPSLLFSHSFLSPLPNSYPSIISSHHLPPRPHPPRPSALRSINIRDVFVFVGDAVYDYTLRADASGTGECPRPLHAACPVSRDTAFSFSFSLSVSPLLISSTHLPPHNHAPPLEDGTENEDTGSAYTTETGDTDHSRHAGPREQQRLERDRAAPKTPRQNDKVPSFALSFSLCLCVNEPPFVQTGGRSTCLTSLPPSPQPPPRRWSRAAGPSRASGCEGGAGAIMVGGGLYRGGIYT